jgi:hypothetical protein
MKKLSFVVATLLTSAIAAPAFAQEADRTNASYAKETSVQYSMLRDYGSTGTFGMLFDFGKQIRPNLNVIGELGLHRVDGHSYTQGAAGLRYGKMTSRKVRSFVQFAAGPQNEWGATGFVFQPGAGVNIRASRKLDTKIQADFPILRWEGNTYKQFRFSVGLGLPLGGK